MMCRISISAFLICILAAIAATQRVTSSPFTMHENEITTTVDFENELKQLPTEETDAAIVENGQLRGALNIEIDEPVPTIPNSSSQTSVRKEVESEEDEEEDDDEDEDDEDDSSSEEDVNEFPKETTSFNDEATLSVISDFDQMDAVEEDDVYTSYTKPAQAQNEVLDEELELEKRMARATNKFLSNGKLDESTVEELVEMLIRFAGDPEQWEKIRQILEKMRYDQITSKKAKARMRALQLQTSTNNENQNNENRKSSEAPIVSEAQNSSHKPIKASKTLVKNGKLKNLSATGLSKSGAFKHKQHKYNNKNRKVDGNNSSSLKMKMLKAEPYKYAMEKPVAVVGERSKPIMTNNNNNNSQMKLLQPLSQSLKAIQLQKSQLLKLANKPADSIEDELKTLGQQERRLKEHFERKQKLLQEIRERNAQRVETANWNHN